MAEVTFENDIAIINFGNDENRLTTPKLTALHECLDKVLANDDAAALICTATGKFFSNGINLQWLGGSTPEEVARFWQVYHSAILRIMCFPMPTICAINGHAFAGGCFLSMAFDYRVMNSDKGWISANEVYMPSRIPQFLMYMLREKLPTSTQRIQVLAHGRRFTAADALSHDLVQAVAAGSALLDTARTIARQTLKYGALPRQGCAELKLDLYRDLIDVYHQELQPDLPKLPIAKL